MDTQKKKKKQQLLGLSATRDKNVQKLSYTAEIYCQTTVLEKENKRD